MFVQISPNENALSETLCSLNFASRVRGIELGPTKKQVESTELLKYKQLVIVAPLYIFHIYPPRTLSIWCIDVTKKIPPFACQDEKKTKLELKSKDVQINKLEDTINSLDWKMIEKDLKNKNFQDKVFYMK